MYIRDPRSRVEKVAPFLTIDGDPYPAVVDGRIVWILDGYTTAATYPYSQKINLATETRDELTGQGQFALARDDVNYMRNSVKATVDAYDGTVKLYEFDDQDPVLKAWNKAFGGHLIIPKAETPARPGGALPLPAGPVQGAAQPAHQVPRDRPAGVLLRPGLLAGAERAGRAVEQRQAAAVLPERRSCPSQDATHVPAHRRRHPVQPGKPGRAGLRLVRRTTSRSCR